MPELAEGKAQPSFQVLSFQVLFIYNKQFKLLLAGSQILKLIVASWDCTVVHGITTTKIGKFWYINILTWLPGLGE